jgi:hypothetical protein
MANAIATSTTSNPGSTSAAAIVNAAPWAAVTTLRQYRNGSCPRSHGMIHPAATNA